MSRASSASTTAALTVRALLQTSSARLKRARLSYGHGTTNALDEAAWLVSHALKISPHNLQEHLDDAVMPALEKRAQDLITKRIHTRMPAAYLLHEAWLGDFKFYVDERVIVPRSYIAELLFEQISPWLKNAGSVKNALDLCTGSGCLAILMAKMFPKAKVDALDISRDALAVARKNVANYKLRSRVNLLHSDMFDALNQNKRNKKYDLIISNPPYVPALAMKKLPTEYKREPKLALAGGQDGFDLVRVILREAAEHLTDNGLLVVEVGHYRKQLEKAFPRLPFIWADTSGGDDCVFILERRDLL